MWIRGKHSTQNYAVRLIHIKFIGIPHHYLPSAVCFTEYSHTCGYISCDKIGTKRI